jgi:phage terminase small subunit
MSKEITTRMSPEGLEIANKYLTSGSVEDVSSELNVSKDIVVSTLQKREVKQYIDTVYMDIGYRNRFKLGDALDTIIEKKLEEAEESEMYSNKDIADLLHLAHKIRMDEMKAQTELEKAKAGNIKTQNNVQVIADQPFGQGNYGKLMDKLLKNPD